MEGLHDDLRHFGIVNRGGATAEPDLLIILGVVISVVTHTLPALYFSNQLATVSEVEDTMACDSNIPMLEYPEHAWPGHVLAPG